MAGLKFFSLAAAAVCLLAKEAQAADPANKAERVNCTTEMNVPRVGAGFAQLQVNLEQLKLPITEADSTTYIKSVCDAMRKYESGTAPTLETTKPEGTFAYAVQTGESADCKAAVDSWKKAFSNFNGLPPAGKDGGDLYKNPANVSLIALFNPDEKPFLDCAYFTCPAAAGKAGSAEEKDLKALLCVTKPKALVSEKAPFTEEQWGKIDAAVNSGSAAVPTFLAVLAAAVATLFL